MVVCNILPSFKKEQLEDGRRFLYEVLRAFREPQTPCELPTLILLTLMQSFFCDGCGMLIEDAESDERGQPSTLRVTKAMRELIKAARQEGRGDEPLALFDQDVNTSYLALPANRMDHAPNTIYLVAWRFGTLFDANDVVDLKVALSLYHTRCPSLLLAGSYQYQCLPGQSSGLDAHSLQSALDNCYDSVILFQPSGQLLWSNETARQHIKSLDLQHHNDDWEWCASILHPDDLQTTIARIMSAIRLQRGLSSSARFMVNILVVLQEYQLLICVAFQIDEGFRACEWRVEPCSFEARVATIWSLSCLRYHAVTNDRVSEALLLGDSVRSLLETIQCASCTSDVQLSSSLAMQGLDRLNRLLVQEGQMGPDISKPEPVLVFLEAIVETAILYLGAELLARDQEVLVNFDKDCPKTIFADKARLEDVFVNYIKGIVEGNLAAGSYTILEAVVEDNGAERWVVFSTTPKSRVAKKSVEFLVVQRLFDFVPGELLIDPLHPTTPIMRIGIGHHGDAPPPAASDESECLFFKTRSELLAELENFIHFKSPLIPVIINCCSESPSCRSFLTTTFQGVRGLQVVSNDISKTRIYKSAMNIFIIDSFSGPVEEWARSENPALLAIARFILLKTKGTDGPVPNHLMAVSVERPLLAPSIIKMVHEAVIRLTFDSLKVPVTMTEFHVDDTRPLSKDRISTFAELYPMRIMVVEDSILNLKCLVKTLEKIGYAGIMTACDGQEAVELYSEEASKNQPVEMIFMDKQMPVLDGCGASRQIRELGRSKKGHQIPGPHIVALTANIFSEDRRECLRAGMCRFAGKPLQWELLEQLIKEGYECLHGKLLCRCRAQQSLDW